MRSENYIKWVPIRGDFTLNDNKSVFNGGQIQKFVIYYLLWDMLKYLYKKGRPKAAFLESAALDRPDLRFKACRSEAP